jgi:hypothetical protein
MSLNFPIVQSSERMEKDWERIGSNFEKSFNNSSIADRQMRQPKRETAVMYRIKSINLLPIETRKESTQTSLSSLFLVVFFSEKVCKVS